MTLEEAMAEIAMLKEAIETNNTEALLWKARLLDRIARRDDEIERLQAELNKEREMKRVITGKLYCYRIPTSKMIKVGCTKDEAESLVRNGAAPHGSIWCPGDLDDSPWKGDLYEPDLTWKGAKPL